MYNCQGLFKQFITCNYHMQLPTLVQSIYKFCTFLSKFSNIWTFFNIYLLFFWKIAPMPLLSRIGTDCTLKFAWCTSDIKEEYSLNNTISLSRHEQVCLMRLRFERYFSHHRDTSPIIYFSLWDCLFVAGTNELWGNFPDKYKRNKK